MKRFAVWASAVLLPACCVAARTSTVAPNHTTLVEQLEQETPALVRWYAEETDDDGKRAHYDNPDKVPEKTQTMLGAYCSAVWVSQDTMLTAAHCVDNIGATPEADDSDDATSALEQLLNALSNPNSPDAKRWDPTGQTVYYSVRGDIDVNHRAYHSGKVSAVDWDNDIALVKATTPGQHPVAPLRRGAVHDGEELHFVGHPMGLWWTYVHGYVAAQRPQYSDGNGHTYPITQVSAPLYFGNSGGGAFDVEGNLVGMSDAIAKAPDTGYCIPVTTIRNFLEHEQVLPPVR